MKACSGSFTSQTFRLIQSRADMIGLILMDLPIVDLTVPGVLWRRDYHHEILKPPVPA